MPVDSTKRLSYLFRVQPDSLAQQYASKTDDELIALAGDLDSLVEEAWPILDDELRRRNLGSSRAPIAAVEGSSATSSSISIANVLRTVGTSVSHLIAAVIGTAIVQSSIWPVLGRPHSLGGIETKAWFASIIIASSLGFLIAKYRPSKTALWIWVLAGVIFALRLFLYRGGPSGNLLEHFLAPNCLHNTVECSDFFGFTLPAVRASAYSLGAWMSLRLHNPTKTDAVAQLL